MNKFCFAALIFSLAVHLLFFVFAIGRGGEKKTPTSIVISRVEIDSEGEEKKSSESVSKAEENSSGAFVPREIPLSPSKAVSIEAPEVEYEEKYTVEWKAPPLPPVAVQGRKDASDQPLVDVPPAVENSVKVRYPNGARKRGEEGDVTLEISIAADGAVLDVKIVESSTFRDLDEAALQAVSLARFIPARARGVNVSSSARLTLSFRLR